MVKRKYSNKPLIIKIKINDSNKNETGVYTVFRQRTGNNKNNNNTVNENFNNYSLINLTLLGIDLETFLI